MGTDAIAEEYIEGRELYVGMLGNARLTTFPVWELLFTKMPPDMPRIATGSVKWNVDYQKRWGIETSFRDIKDMRFGMGLSARRVSKPQRRDRLLLLSALAIALLSLLGAAGESLGYDRMLKANTSKKRTHSLFRQGHLLYDLIPNMPEQRLRPLLKRFGEMLLEHGAFKAIFGTL